MIMRLLLRLVFNVIALYVAAWAITGITYGDKWWSLLIAAAVFTVVNMFVKPVVKLLSLPFIVITLGLFLLVVNVFMLYITDWIVDDFEIASFGAGLLAAIVVSLVNWVLSIVVPGEQ